MPPWLLVMMVQLTVSILNMYAYMEHTVNYKMCKLYSDLLAQTFTFKTIKFILVQ